MKKLFLALFTLWCLTVLAYAQNTITLPLAANVVADVGNGPIKVRMISGNASIFSMQSSGTGGTVGASTTLTLTGTPATPPLVGALISGNGITSGTTVASYSGVTIGLSAAMTVPAGTTVSWGAACPASAAGIPTQYIQASPQADYFLLYTQARICAVSRGGNVNTLLTMPVFYDQTTPGGGGSGAVSSVFGRTGAVVAQAGDYNFNQLSGSVGCAQLPSFTGDVTNVACALTIGAAKVTAAMLQAGAASSNVGALGGVLSGTLPNPGWANAGANTVLSNWTAGAAAPIFNTWPACANDGTHALVYVNGSGLACASISAGSGTVTSITLTASTAITLTGTCTVTTSGTCVVGVDKATAANYEAATSNKALTADNVFTSEVALTFNATQVMDFNTFFNASVTMTGNITSFTCSNQKAGQAGIIRFIQDGTGSRTLPATFGCNMKFAGGTQPVASTSINLVDALAYQCLSSSYCIGSYLKNVQ